jgi:hypothetical protein
LRYRHPACSGNPKKQFTSQQGNEYTDYCQCATRDTFFQHQELPQNANHHQPLYQSCLK